MPRGRTRRNEPRMDWRCDGWTADGVAVCGSVTNDSPLGSIQASEVAPCNRRQRRERWRASGCCRKMRFVDKGKKKTKKAWSGKVRTVRGLCVLVLEMRTAASPISVCSHPASVTQPVTPRPSPLLLRPHHPIQAAIPQMPGPETRHSPPHHMHSRICFVSQTTTTITTPIYT